jgi:hypothetical protein
MSRSECVLRVRKWRVTSFEEWDKIVVVGRVIGGGGWWVVEKGERRRCPRLWRVGRKSRG